MNRHDNCFRSIRLHRASRLAVMIGFLVFGSVSVSLAQIGNLDYEESADFSLDVRLGRPSWGGSSLDTDLTLTPIARVWGDSNEILFGDSLPELRVVRQASSGSAVLDWLSVYVDGKLYHWKVQTADATPLEPGPLSKYRGSILGIAALDAQGRWVTDPAELRAAFVVTENAAMLAAATFQGSEAGVGLNFIGNTVGSVDDQSTHYSVDQSLVSTSTGSAGKFLEFNDVSGLDDRATRRRIWKELALEVALQTSLFARTDAGSSGVEQQDQRLKDYVVEQLRALGECEEGFELFETLSEYDAAPAAAHLLATEASQRMRSIADRFMTLKNRAPANSQLAAKLDRLGESLDDLGSVLSVAVAAANWTGEVSKAMTLQAVAQAAGEDRLLTLQLLADAGAFADPAAAEGIADAVNAYAGIKDSYLQAWAYLRDNYSLVQHADQIAVTIRGALAAGHLTLNLTQDVLPKVAQRLAFLNSPVAKVFSRSLGAATSAISIATSIDSTLRVMREADLAATMEREIRQCLQAHRNLGSNLQTDDLQRLLAIDGLRHYLAYWHFTKCLNIIKSEWWDFYKVILLDPIGGLVWLQGILNSESRDMAIAIYEYERARAIDKALRATDPRGRIAAPLWNRLDDLLVPSLQSSGYQEVTAIDLSAGVQQWVYFEATNHGAATTAAYLSVSMPDGVEVLETSLDGLTGAWAAYPIGGGPVWQRGDHGAPTLQPLTDTLYEYQGPFPANATHRPGLLLRATRDGVFWLKARLAFLPAGADPDDQSVYARHPLTGPVDQQGWEAIQVDAVSGVRPCPVLSVISPVGTLLIVQGQAVDVQFMVVNDCSPSLETYVDISHDSGLEVEYLHPWNSWEYYEPGDDDKPIYHADGQWGPAENVLFSQHTGRMPAMSPRIYTIRVRGSELGTRNLYVRSSLRGVTMAPGDFVRSPETGEPDQQGWPVTLMSLFVKENEGPLCTNPVPADPVLIRQQSGILSFAITAVDPDNGPEPLSYLWTLDGMDNLGTDPTLDLDLSILSLGQHTVSVMVSDGQKSCMTSWELTIGAEELETEMSSDVNSQVANLPIADQTHTVAFTAHVTDPAANTSFAYHWFALVHPVTGRRLGLVSGGGTSDNVAIYATPVSPIESNVPYRVACIVTGEQTGATGLASKDILVTSATFSLADFDRDGDVDLVDFHVFQECASGPEVPSASGCETKDLDGDGDVDQSDFGIFQRCYSGDGIPADPACAS